MRRRAESQVEAPGQDSFLDVVCNLVGILIILVMLVAAQAKRGLVVAATGGAASSAVAVPTAEDHIRGLPVGIGRIGEHDVVRAMPPPALPQKRLRESDSHLRVIE